MLPTLLGLPPKAQFEDVVRKINQLVNEMTNLLLNLDSLNVVSLTADHIDSGTIDAGMVTIRSLLNAGAFIRIDGTGMTVNDGTKDVFTVDVNGHVTMTGALVQSSASSYPRVELNSSSTLIKAAQTVNERIEIAASYSAGTPAFLFYEGGAIKANFQLVGGTDIFIAALLGYKMSFSANNHINFSTTSGGDINLSASGDVGLNPSGNLEINGSAGFTGTFSTGTQTITVTKGIITNVV